MGDKGAKLTSEAEATAEIAVEELASLGAIRSKKMFGGFGVFDGETMFAIVDPKGALFFRADDETRPRYEAAGSEKHSRVPYFGVPEEVIASMEDLIAWGSEALDVARRAKKR